MQVPQERRGSRNQRRNCYQHIEQALQDYIYQHAEHRAGSRRRVIIEYLSILPILALTMLLTLGLQHTVNDFDLEDGILVLAFSIVALLWGWGPALLLLFPGMLILFCFIVPGEGDMITWPNIIQLFPFALVGIVIGFLSLQRDKGWIKTHLYAHELVITRQRLEDQAALLQLAHDAFIVQDEQNRITFWSQGSVILYGWSEQEAVGNVAFDLLQTQFPLPLSEIHAILRREGPWQGELEHIARNGKHVIVDSRWQLIGQQEGSSLRILEVNRDITERVRLERYKDEFISMASHELKTPVTSLKGFTHILQRRLTKQGDEQGLHYLARMDTQLDRLTILINDLLDLSCIQMGKLVLRMEPFDLDALINETVENVQAVTLTHHLLVEGRTGMQILGDKDRLGQVVINLLTNAIKYSPGADTVLVQLSQNGEQAIVSVQDFGIGIDKSHHESLFERFYRVTDPEEKTYPGLGIGLSISREIVERHHGRIWVESSKGQGSTFFVALPSSREQEAGLNAEDSQKNLHRGR